MIPEQYKIELVYPGEEALKLIERQNAQRAINLSDLHRKDGICRWCGVRAVPTKRHFYCTKMCQTSAYFILYPQSPRSKGYQLVERQQCACVLCGTSYEDQILSIVATAIKRKHWCVYYMIGYQLPLDLDHRTPIFKGGAGVSPNFENHQVICRPCHRKKTSNERRKDS